MTVRTPPQRPSVSRIDVVALVASAGGIHALGRVLSGLPRDFEAAVVVVLHLQSGQPSMLADVLARRSPLPVKQAVPGDRLEPGHVYVAPPDAHLIMREDGALQLDMSPPIHFLRPSADVFLASLASSHSQRALAVVLSGSGHDGALGATAVKESGGIVLAQDESTSEYFGMPSAAIASGAVDRVLALDDIAAAVVAFVRPSLS
ncbi:MAG TPA: chemotaxis protein CheB [Gaiellaceae bacterium]|jgi:two-component system chemotaxis response regulator CheB